MSNKNCENYSAVFKYIEKNVFNLEPESFMTDFEAGMRAAVRKCYPNVALHGCWFHFCSAIRKKSLQLGYHDLITTNSQAKFIQKAMMSIPLLPANDIENGYLYIKEKADENKLSSEFQKMFDYFDSYWLVEVRISIKKNPFIMYLYYFIIRFSE